MDDYNWRVGLSVGVLAPDGRKCCAVIDTDVSIIISPIIGAGGQTQPGFSLSKNDGEGNAGENLCTTQDGYDYCLGYGNMS